MLPGVYASKKKNGEVYYRSSLTYRCKHISLGSFPNEEMAHRAYLDASKLLYTPNVRLEDHSEINPALSFVKWVTLINFRDNELYIKTPIYMKNRYFLYYLDQDTVLTFDVDDLFYYSTHSIIRRNGHLFVCDFGMQVNLLSRYGIKNYAVAGKDYLFINGNPLDFRYSNIEIVNRYHGVFQETKNGRIHYTAKIHINGYTIVGRYETDYEAAIAYNKAALTLNKNGLKKDFPMNYIEEIDSKTYHKLFETITISDRITTLAIGK